MVCVWITNLLLSIYISFNYYQVGSRFIVGSRNQTKEELRTCLLTALDILFEP